MIRWVTIKPHMNRSQTMKRFFITAKINTPLLTLLQDLLPEKYAPNAETIITHGGVWQNKKRVMNPTHVINAQETIKIHTSNFQGKTYVLDKHDIVFENSDFMAVYKPVDLNVHAVPSSFYYNLAYGVNSYLEEQGIPFEANPVTRLDRPVEGLVLFPKHKHSERLLFKLSKERKIKKWYMAALEHRPDNPTRLRITDKISTDGKRTALDPNGKTADSLFIKIQCNNQSMENADIYSVFIFTGRRHQIRFHASHYIAPILGDWFYGSHYGSGGDEISLACRGYNIPYRRERIKIRLPQHYLDQFFKRLNTRIPPV